MKFYKYKKCTEAGERITKNVNEEQTLKHNKYKYSEAKNWLLMFNLNSTVFFFNQHSENFSGKLVVSIDFPPTTFW